MEGVGAGAAAVDEPIGLPWRMSPSWMWPRGQLSGMFAAVEHCGGAAAVDPASLRARPGRG